MIRKAFDARIVDTQPGRREIVACISTDSLDRQNEVVLPHGLRKKNYAGMTVFYDHNTALPVGAAQWVKQQDGRILAKFRCTDKTAFARDIFALAQDGILTSYSIGFMPLEASAPTAAEIARRPEWHRASRIYRQWELLEFSIVGIAANPDATMLAISKKVSPESLAILQMDRAHSPVNGNVAGCMAAAPPNPVGDHEMPLHRLSAAEIIRIATECWKEKYATGPLHAAIESVLAHRAGRID